MTHPNHPYRRAHTMDSRHPRALFPAPVPTDSRPTIGVLALQGDVREHSLALEAAGARPVVVRRATDLGQAPGDRLDGLVIPGGESTTMSTLLVAFEMLAPLRWVPGRTGRCTPSSSAPPGWRRWGRASRSSPRPAQDERLGSAGPTAVGSSRFVRGPCSPPPSTRRSEATTGSTTSSSPW